jgi:hypothetical protein
LGKIIFHIAYGKRKKALRSQLLTSAKLGIPEKSNQPGTFILAKFLAKESNSV